MSSYNNDQPGKASMDAAVVRQLFKSIDEARTIKPSVFRIDTQCLDGMGQVAVLVIDSVLFDRLILPLLKQYD